MSAYICNPEQFKALAIFAACRSGASAHRVDPRIMTHLHETFAADSVEKLQREYRALAEYYANVLYHENVRSVQARYPGPGLLPGPVDLPDEITVTNRDTMRQHPRPIDVLKMIHCLEYQSCETDDWRDTEAHSLLQVLKDVAIRELPGYDEATRDAA